MPPGKHHYWFSGENKLYYTEEAPTENIPGTDYIVNYLEVPLRPDEPQLWSYPKQRHERTFAKPDSVVADWEEDDAHKVEKMLNADNKFSKISRVVKQTHLYTDLWESLTVNYKTVHEMFLFGVASSTTFPSIGWMDFDEICKKV